MKDDLYSLVANGKYEKFFLSHPVTKPMYLSQQITLPMVNLIFPLLSHDPKKRPSASSLLEAAFIVDAVNVHGNVDLTNEFNSILMWYIIRKDENIPWDYYINFLNNYTVQTGVSPKN